MLGRIGSEARGAASRSPRRSSTAAGQRLAAVRALGQVTADSGAAVPALRQALADHDGEVRETAAAALGRIGPNAVAAAPDLAACLTDFGDGLRGVAGQALLAIGAPAVPALTAALTGDDPERAHAAAWVLGQLAEQAQPALPALTAAARSADAELRLRCCAAVAVPSDDPEALAVLLACLRKTTNSRVPDRRMVAGAADAQHGAGGAGPDSTVGRCG